MLAQGKASRQRQHKSAKAAQVGLMQHTSQHESVNAATKLAKATKQLVSSLSLVPLSLASLSLASLSVLVSLVSLSLV
jgi:hypothetical protein